MLQDLRHGLRIIRRNPGFSSVAVLALALGIGANTAIFSLIDAAMLRPPAYRDPERLALVWMRSQSGQLFRSSGADYLDWRNQNQVFENITAVGGATFLLTGVDQPEQIPGARVAASFFSVFGVRPALGRPFTAEEDAPPGQPVVVISNGLWKRHFGADPRIIGQTVTLNYRRVTIVGVLPPEFRFPASSDVLAPLGLRPNETDREVHGLLVVARLKPAITVERASADMAAIAHRLEEIAPKTNRGITATVEPLWQAMVDHTKLPQTLPVLLGAVGFVLLISCVNVANLLLARAASRQREMAIRAAMGAGRRRIALQLLVESLLLSSMGGLLGLALGFWFVKGAPSFLPAGSLPLGARLQLDLRVLLFTAAVSVLTAILFGLVPAIQASRARLTEAMKASARGSSGAAGSARFRVMLVMSEVALAAMLMFSAGVLAKSLVRLTGVDPGIRTENLLTMRVTLPLARYADAVKISLFYREALARLRSLPGVRSAAVVSQLPLRDWGLRTQFEIEGQPQHTVGERPLAHFQVVSADYVPATGLSLQRGRFFSERDDEKAALVAVVNEYFVRKHFEKEDPIGRRLRMQSILPSQTVGPEVTLEIIGVVADVKVASLSDTGEPEIYVPYPQSPWPSSYFVVKTATAPQSLINGARLAIRSLDPDLPVVNLKTMDRVVAESTSEPRFRVMLLGSFAGIALLLATIGIYGVVSYSVAQRRQEIGIRMAIGASPADVLRMVVRQGFLMALFGIFIGVGGGFFVLRVLANLLFGVAPIDPEVIVGVSFLLLAVAMAASYIPARRAMKVDPVHALRYE